MLRTYQTKSSRPAKLPSSREALELELILIEEEQRRRAAEAEALDPVRPPVFRGDNLAVQSYRGREWILAGPSDTGKTWSTCWLLDSLLRETPRAKAVMARKTQVSIGGSVLQTFKSVLEIRKGLGDEEPRVYGGEHPQFYIYPNGARLWVGGMDHVEKMLSAERDFIYINQAEELEKEDWEVLYSRCTGRGAVTKTPMLFGDCNPGNEDHWILQRPTIKLFKSRHVDNPSLYDDDGNLRPEAQQRVFDLQTLTGVRYKRLWEGLWVGVEGLFFEEWDEKRHVVEPFPIPADWPIWGALDYGYSHPTAFGLFTKSGDGCIYMIGEHVQRKWPVNFHCRAIRRLMATIPALDPLGNVIKGIKPSRVRKLVAGHDLFSERGAEEDQKKLCDQYRDAVNPEDDDLLDLPKGAPIGFKFEPANCARMTGSQEMLTRLGKAEMMVQPTLKFFNSCPRTIACMTRMVADPKNPEEYLKVDADPTTGLGGDDEVDMCRYGVMAEWMGRKGVMRVTQTRVK